MFQYFELEKLHPLSFGPHKEIEFWIKMFIDFDRVYFSFRNEFLIFAETSLALSNSKHLKVIYLFKIIDLLFCVICNKLI